MNILLIQVDGKLPNIALMRIAAHHREKGDTVELIHQYRTLFTIKPDLVYASLIFEKSVPRLREIREQFPGIPFYTGGTGYHHNVRYELSEVGITTKKQDYSLYPLFLKSIGFTQRGCRLKCKFCVVPTKEGAVVEENTIADIWRGDPYPRELLLLDNDFFGQPNWRDRIQEIRDGHFKVSFNQGINARFLTEEAAEAIASVHYCDDSMRFKRIYTAWDNRKDEDRLFTGLQHLVDAGVPGARSWSTS